MRKWIKVEDRPYNAEYYTILYKCDIKKFKNIILIHEYVKIV